MADMAIIIGSDTADIELDMAQVPGSVKVLFFLIRYCEFVYVIFNGSWYMDSSRYLVLMYIAGDGAIEHGSVITLLFQVRHHNPIRRKRQQ